MASTYPTTLDAFATTRADATVAATTHALDHNNNADAINKIEAELGTNPSAAFATVKDRLDGMTTVRKTADQTNTTVTLANVTDLAFPIATGIDYAFRFIIPFSTSLATAGLGLALTIPALTGYMSARIDIPRLVEPAVSTAPASTMIYSGAATSSGDAVVADAAPAATTIYIATIDGILSNASAAGTLQVQCRAEVAATITIKKGAHGVLWTG